VESGQLHLQQRQHRRFYLATGTHRTPPTTTLLHSSPFELETDTMAPVTFWSAPGTYIHWAARYKPAILWSIVVGCMGPVVVVGAQYTYGKGAKVYTR